MQNILRDLATTENLKHWVIGGDLNVDQETLKALCHNYLIPKAHCISTSGLDLTGVRKSDIAISQGICLQDIPSWVGYSFEPHVSDAHDMVPVLGTLLTRDVSQHAEGDSSADAALLVAPAVSSVPHADNMVPVVEPLLTSDVPQTAANQAVEIIATVGLAASAEFRSSAAATLRSSAAANVRSSPARTFLTLTKLKRGEGKVLEHVKEWLAGI